jgi:murein tripeptide amidase MpaA
LSFEYEFEYEDDEVYFAYCIPYTYSCLLKELNSLPKTDQENNKILERSENGNTLMGLPIHILKITNHSIPDQQKKIVLVTGRIHPGESNGSIVLSGMMQYLCSPEAAALRKSTVFIIVPMMNPDGVIMGNYRTGAAGKDLNRVYTRLNK